MPRGRRWVLPGALALASLQAVPTAAQTVVQLEGGGSSLVHGYGATANFWRPGADGWVGLGYLDGLRVGAFLRTGLRRDTLRLGNDALLLRFPTDVFSGGTNLLVQGIGLTGGSARTGYALFGGASANGIGAQSFQPTSIERPLGAAFLHHRLTPALRLTATTIFSDRQTLVPGAEWQPAPDLTTALVAGIGADRPYTASSLTLRRGPVGVKASYTWSGSGFRRVSVPTPYQTETDRENVLLTYDLGREFTLGLGRQNFVQNASAAGPATRASGNSAFAGGRWLEWRMTAGLYHSRSQGISNLSSYFALGRELRPWLDAEIFLLQSRPEGRPASTIPVANLRWRVSPRLALMQQLSLQHQRGTMLVGATVTSSLGELGVDYQIVHQPFQPLRPFRSALNLTARLSLGNYSTSLGTYIRPDGAVDYSASGSTFLYLGSFGGVQPQLLGGGRIAQYVVRGTVRDPEGYPVEGAALDIGGQVVFTDSWGGFFLRDSRPRRVPFRVLTEEFLLSGRWEVVQAPTEVLARPERRAETIELVLRRTGPPALPRPIPAPPPSDSAAGGGEPVKPASTPAAGVPAPLLERYAAPRPVATFRWGSRQLSPTAAPMLDSLARELVSAPDVRLEIRGHADSTGSQRYNRRLSRRRAEAVRRDLIARGVATDRLGVRGLGAEQPLESNATPAGRARNRRVEVRAQPADSAESVPQ